MKIYTSYDFAGNQIKNLGNPVDSKDAVPYGMILKKFTSIVGNGSSTTFSINHNLSTMFPVIQIRLTSSPYTFLSSGFSISLVDSNTASISFTEAPSESQYTIIIVG